MSSLCQFELWTFYRGFDEIGGWQERKYYRRNDNFDWDLVQRPWTYNDLPLESEYLEVGLYPMCFLDSRHTMPIVEDIIRLLMSVLFDYLP